MLRSSVQESPEFKRVVDSLILSANNFDRFENRSAMRESLVVPVRVALCDSEVSLPGFTRNISNSGVGLLLPTEVNEGASAIVTMERADGVGKHRILSECRWCKPYGEAWVLSGWRFIHLKS